MIGAAVVQRRVRSGHETSLNNGDLARLMADWADDSTWTFPGDIPISGQTRGKKAIEACFASMLEHYPKMHCTVNEAFVSNIFALGATNNVALEYDLTVTNHEGKEFHNRGVAIVVVKGGKVVAARDYLFSTDILKESWGEE